MTWFLLLSLTVIPILLAIGGYFLGHNKTLASGFFLAAFVVALIAIADYNRQETTKETETHGFLIPGNTPSPELPGCLPPSREAVTLHFGSSVGFLTEFSRQSIITVKGESLLSFDRSPKGLRVSANIYDENGMVASLRDNEFNITPSNYHRRERPNQHTLIVYDRWGKKVLDVHYLNSSAIRVLGIFRSPKLKSPIVIDEEALTMPYTHISANCLGNAKDVLKIP